MPAYLETVMGHGAFIGGLLLMPLVVASIIGSLLNSQIVSRIGYRTAAIISLFMLAAGMSVMGVAIFQSGMTVGWFLLIAGQVIAGLGLGVGQPVMLTWAMDCVPAEYSGAGSSLLTVFRQFGSIIGVGIFGSIAGNVYTAQFRDDSPAVSAGLISAGSVNLDFQQAQRLANQTAQLLKSVASRAYESSMIVSFLIAAIIIVITTAIVATISRRQKIAAA